MLRKLPILFVVAFVALSLSGASLKIDNPVESKIDSSLIGRLGDPKKSPKKGVSSLQSRRIADTNINVLIDEDFSLFEAGTEEDPDMEFLAEDGNPYIDDSLTKQPGWSTNYATQAGGTCAINTIIGGFINTPIGDYSGTVTISFRAKRLSESPVTATIGVMLLYNDIWSPAPLYMEYARIFEDEVNGEGELDENGWKKFSYTFENTYSSNDTFVQFGAYYCQVLIDDVKITVEDKGDVAAPQVLPATDFKRDGFTAHWSDVRLADSYLFSMYHEQKISDPLSVTYDFDTAEDLEGWTLENGASSTSDKGYEGSQAIVIDTNNYLVSPNYEGRLESITIWLRNIGEKPAYCSLTLQGYDGREWHDVGSLYLDMVPMDEEGSTLLIDGNVRPAFYDTYHQVRFYFRGWEEDQEEGINPLLAVDHIQVKTLDGVERVYDISALPLETTEYVVKDMDPFTDYFYEVAAVRGEYQAWSLPILAYGISMPVALAPSEVSADSYTANWEPTPKATMYRVRDLGVFEASSYVSEYGVLEEVFDDLEGGTRDEPLFFNNDFMPCSLDEYTSYPGWVGASTIIGDGMLGVGSNGYTYIQTPELTLNNGDCNFTVEITVDLLGEDGILITPSSATGEYIGFEAEEGENSVALNYSNGSSNETLRIRSQYGTPFYIKSIRVAQDLNAGDKVYTYLEGHVIEGESYNFKNVDFSTYPTHAFDVMAIYNRGVSQCVSERSPYTEVGEGNGVKLLDKEDAAFTVNSGKGYLVINTLNSEEVTILSLDGKVVARTIVDGNKEITLPAGIYVVRHGSKSVKVAVK